MKLWYSFTKEIKLASSSFYFYVEFIMAAIIILLLLFVIPDSFQTTASEYLSFDMPEMYMNAFIDPIVELDSDNVIEDVSFTVDDREIKGKLYEGDNRKIYVLNSQADVEAMAKDKKHLGAHIMFDGQAVTYDYYLQGYEADRLKNLLKILHINDFEQLEESVNAIDVRSLQSDVTLLSDRENVIPSFLTFNGSLMGLFIITAYIFLDRQAGIVKAYAVTASSVEQYLLSKIGVVTLTSLITSLLIVIPMMGLRINYLMLIVFLITSGFFASALGLWISSFYKSIMQAFGTIYLVMILMILPNIAYFIPSWNPLWIKVLPTYPLLQGFKEILSNGDMAYVWMASGGFLAVGILFFVLANHRFKKTLTV